MNKFLKSLLATLLFVACLLIAYVLRMRFGEVNVVFYSTLGCAALAVLLAGAMLYLSRGFSAFSALEKFQLLVIWLLVGYAFAISVPTVIDRSLSFYLLEKLQQRGGGIRQDRFQDVFVKEYMVEHRLVDVRLTEQLESGTIEINQGCVRLTPRGERLASFSRWFRANLLPRRRLLMGQYSDDLTHPFQHSTATVDYTCP
ncbi:MAG: hypothetical protein H7147_12330 [Frankiaceae bacterium]|nr:hypothetical protein [Arenimonas sp.]